MYDEMNNEMYDEMNNEMYDGWVIAINMHHRSRMNRSCSQYRCGKHR